MNRKTLELINSASNRYPHRLTPQPDDNPPSEVAASEGNRQTQGLVWNSLRVVRANWTGGAQVSTNGGRAKDAHGRPF